MAQRLYVGGLAYEAKEADIEDLFKKYGEVRTIALKSGFGFVEYADERDAEDAIKELDRTEFFGRTLNVQMAKNEPRGANGARSGDDRPRYRSRSRSRDYRRDDRRVDDYRRGDDRRDDRRGDDRRGGYRDERDSRRRSRSRGYDRSRERNPRYERPRSTKYRLALANMPTGANWQDIKDFARQAGQVTYADVRREDPTEGICDFATREDLMTAIEKLQGADMNGSKVRVFEEGTQNEGGRDRSPALQQSRGRSPRRDSRSRSPKRDFEEPVRKEWSRSRSRGRD